MSRINIRLQRLVSIRKCVPRHAICPLCLSFSSLNKQMHSTNIYHDPFIILYRTWSLGTRKLNQIDKFRKRFVKYLSPVVFLSNEKSISISNRQTIFRRVFQRIFLTISIISGNVKRTNYFIVCRAITLDEVKCINTKNKENLRDRSISKLIIVIFI